ETEDGQWALSFYAHPLGIIDTRRMKLVRRSAAPTKPLGAAADE
ncbi:MAG: integrase, partial [Mesorhizobium sp.]